MSQFNNRLTSLFKKKQFKISFLSCLILFSFLGNAQVLINEASNRNLNQILDEDGENEDWIELFNSTNEPVNIGGWSITDNKSKIRKWVFPSSEISAKSHLLIFASGKDRGASIHGENWESAILPTDNFNYLIPNTNTPSNWNTLAFNASSWSTGQAGFGFGDGDDRTTLTQGITTAYIRKSFIVTDLDALVSAICHVDYDDGFVAYINGIEICRSNITGTPSWNSVANGNHEAVMFSGGNPEAFEIDSNVLASALQQGENLFSIEVHNVNTSSSDLSLIPYLSFSFNGDNTYFSEAPDFMNTDNNNDIELHTNFKISEEGETVYLYNASQVLIDSMVVNLQSVNYSYGREKDGTDKLAIFTQATPGATNNNQTAYTDGYEGKPIFSIPAGYHSNTISVAITSTSNTTQIRYTLNGSEPTTSSSLYNGPITLTKSTTLNAKTFSTSGKLHSLVSTNTYLINEDFTVPVLSVTTDSSNLFGDDGIFTNNQEEWNKPCYIEYFETDGTLAFSQRSGIQVDGGAGGSRTNPQTSFRIEPANGTYGEGALEYNFHPNRPNRTKYESLYLRNGSNQYLTLQYKDGAQVRAMGQNTNNFYSEYRPIVVFINGEYYGLYEGREKINADYLESNYNMNTDDMDMVGISHFNKPKTILANTGSVEPFLEDYERFKNMNPSDENYLEEVAKFLDLENYTDYMAAQTWMTNQDWPHNNMKAWRTAGSNMRWQFGLVDLEWSFLPTRTEITSLATVSSFDQIQYMNSKETDWPASGYWYMLMQNDDYKNHFINRLCDLMNTNYAYDELNKVETDIYEEMLPEVPANYLRWNGGDPAVFTTNHQALNQEFKDREPYVRQHLREHYNLNHDVEISLDVVGYGKTKISTITPENYPWSGDYFSNTPITIEAIPNPGYKFVGWEENNLIDDLTKENFTIELTSSNSVNFVAKFELGRVPFTDVTISEINYKEGDDFNTTDWFEIYNGTNNAISLEGWYFTDSNPTHRFDFDSQTVIESNGYLAVAKTLDRFNENYPSVTNVVGGFDFGFGSDDTLNVYNANGELVVKVEYSDDAPWALNGDDAGHTLELLNYTQELSDPLAWFKGCFKGSPGQAYNENCEEDLSTTDNQFADRKTIAYPIPAEDQINLSVYLDHSESSVNLEIYDLTGKIVKTMTASNLNSGNNIINIDIRNLNSGLYILVINKSDKTDRIKIIKK